jgi:hypothetical protein
MRTDRFSPVCVHFVYIVQRTQTMLFKPVNAVLVYGSDHILFIFENPAWSVVSGLQERLLIYTSKIMSPLWERNFCTSGLVQSAFIVPQMNYKLRNASDGKLQVIQIWWVPLQIQLYHSDGTRPRYLPSESVTSISRQEAGWHSLHLLLHTNWVTILQQKEQQHMDLTTYDVTKLRTIVPRIAGLYTQQVTQRSRVLLRSWTSVSWSRNSPNFM